MVFVSYMNTAIIILIILIPSAPFDVAPDGSTPIPIY